MLRVSVIIPVYNAAAFVRRAVESANSLAEVGEIILIEDGSSDNSLAVCTELALEFPKVRLARHTGGVNQGAGASRNVGVKSAACEFISFLDADDWYLPNRFQKDKQVLEDKSIDGCYNALANSYSAQEWKTQWLEQGRPEVVTLQGNVGPDELLNVLLGNHSVGGAFHTNTITLRKEVFAAVGGFNAELRLQQDTELWHRLAAFGRLAPSNIVEPTAVRFVHSGNRMTHMDEQEKYFELWWASLRKNLVRLGVEQRQMQSFNRAYARFRASRKSKLRAVAALIHWVSKEPNEIVREYEHFDLTVRQIFREKRWIIRALSFKNRAVRSLRGDR